MTTLETIQFLFAVIFAFVMILVVALVGTAVAMREREEWDVEEACLAYTSEAYNEPIPPNHMTGHVEWGDRYTPHIDPEEIIREEEGEEP